MPGSIQYPGIIDKVRPDKDGTVVLIMNERGPRGGSDPKTVEFLDRANVRLAPRVLQIRLRVLEVVTPEMQRQKRPHDGKLSGKAR